MFRSMMWWSFAGCAATDALEPGARLEPFALVDENPSSASFGEVVRTDAAAVTTAWYFGHAT
jgi:hypothetical protein